MRGAGGVDAEDSQVGVALVDSDLAKRMAISGDSVNSKRAEDRARGWHLEERAALRHRQHRAMLHPSPRRHVPRDQPAGPALGVAEGDVLHGLLAVTSTATLAAMQHPHSCRRSTTPPSVSACDSRLLHPLAPRAVRWQPYIETDKSNVVFEKMLLSEGYEFVSEKR